MSDDATTVRRREARRRVPRRRARKVAKNASPSAQPGSAVRRERLALVAATTAMIGLSIVGIAPSDAGAIVTLVGLVGLMYSVHKYGRLGIET